MTEAEWLAGTDPGPMLEFLRGRAGGRKLRLFACACCHRVEPLFALYGDFSRWAVVMAERFAEGRADAAQLRKSHESARSVWGEVGRRRRGGGAPLSAVFAAGAAVSASAADGPEAAARQAAEAAALADPLSQVGGHAAELAAQAALLRELFGPLPFRRVSLDPAVLAWHDRTVVRVAEGAYQGRRWADLPVLADALLDAGCDSDEVVTHLRGPGPHVRGCWVIDLLTGRS